jgi:DNA-binding ferritin-like protein
MINVLVAMTLCEWYANELHYNSSGENFYSLHLLADKLDFGDSMDELKERYYLGEKSDAVPTDAEISTLCLAQYKSPTEGEYHSALADACDILVYAIEEAKRVSKPTGGVCAVLDEISGVALTVGGLCKKVS